jgi:uncharacterized protein with PIN domain
LLGYDCVTRPGQSSRALLEQAAAEERVFLTRNAHLRDTLPQALLARARIELVAAEHLPEQIRNTVAKFTLDTEAFVFTRCLGCNEPLRRADEKFWCCPRCGKTFWRGSHVTNSLARLRVWLSPR